MSLLKPADFRNGRWQNSLPTEVGATRHLPAMFRKLLTNKAETTPRRTLGPFRTDPAVYRTPPASGIRITLLGHSSLLVELDGTTLLIDPVFAQRASMVQWFGPKRFFAPPLALADLPPLDAVLLTHDHYDHLGAETVKHLAKRTPDVRWIAPVGVGKRL